MAKVDLVRRAEIGREKRARTRALILEAGAMLLAERPPEALTVDAVVEAADVAKGTFYYHFQSISELAAAVGATLGESFNEVLTPARLELRDPLARLAFGVHAVPGERDLGPCLGSPRGPELANPDDFGRGIREHLKADLAEAISHGRLTVRDVDLAADIVMGIWLQVMRSILERGARHGLTREALEAMLRALGAAQPDVRTGHLTAWTIGI